MTGPILGPRIVLKTFQASRCGLQRPAIWQRCQVAPVDRHRHQGSRPRAWREGRNRCVRAIVPQVIDQDLAFASDLGERRRIETRLRSHNRLADLTREFKSLQHVARGRDRHHDMQPTSARRFHPRCQSERLEHGADDAGGCDNLLPCDGRPGVEVPDDADWAARCSPSLNSTYGSRRSPSARATQRPRLNLRQGTRRPSSSPES